MEGKKATIFCSKAKAGLCLSPGRLLVPWQGKARGATISQPGQSSPNPLEFGAFSGILGDLNAPKM